VEIRLFEALLNRVTILMPVSYKFSEEEERENMSMYLLFYLEECETSLRFRDARRRTKQCY
jgi:hypothetical protein